MTIARFRACHGLARFAPAPASAHAWGYAAPALEPSCRHTKGRGVLVLVRGEGRCLFRSSGVRAQVGLGLNSTASATANCDYELRPRGPVATKASESHPEP